MCRMLWLVLAAATVLPYGCLHSTQDGQAAPHGTVVVEALDAAAICRGRFSTPQAVWIDSLQNFKVFWERIHSQRLGVQKPPLPQVDWDTHSIILIQMGQKNSGGYGLRLFRPEARLHNDIAFVTVNWIEPPANAIVTQAITHPCLLVKMERGAYHRVVVEDASGRQRASVDF